jgi:glutamate-1-semialdehyde 2,1-aminomutase
VLIFDEILSGFRTGPSCAQGFFGVYPDLCTLGKALAGGLPLSAFGGRREVMEAVSPLGAAVNSGTYNANLIPILATQAFLKLISDPSFWTDLRAKEETFYAGLRSIFSRTPYPAWVQATGTRFGLLFGLDHEPRTYREVASCDRELETRFYREAFARGVYFHFSRHHGFSAAHTDNDLDQALTAIAAAAMSVRPAENAPATAGLAKENVGG